MKMRLSIVIGLWMFPAGAGLSLAAGPAGVDLSALPSPVLFSGDAVTAYRDPAAVYHGGLFHLFFTLTRIEPDKQVYMVTAASRSADLVHWTTPQLFTPRDQNLNFCSPGNVIRQAGQWILCLQTYPRPHGENFGNADSRIWIMRSSDLEHWGPAELLRVKGPDVPREKMGRMIDPFLLRDKDDPGKWWCFYKQHGMSFSWSRDLTSWTFAGSVKAGENACLLVDGDEYVLFHSPGNGIGVKRSQDLKTWRDEGLLTLGQKDWPWAQGRLTAGFVLDLRKEPGIGKCLMFFHGSAHAENDPRGGFDNYASLGIAWSEDLKHWTWPAPAACRAAEAASGASFYVSTEGRDDWSGKLAEPNPARTDGPFATLAKARDAVGQIKSPAAAPVVVYVRGGLYTLKEPLVFTPQDSATAKAPVVYAAYPKEVPVLSGGRSITGWKPAGGKAGLWMAEVPEVKEGRWYFHQLFVNGQRRQRARTPNQGFFNVEGQISTDNPARFQFHAGDIRAEWASTEAEIVGLNKWQFYRMFIQAVDAATHTVTLSRTRLPSSEEQNSRYWMENTPDAPDAPGEWYLSRREGVVYYLPLPGEDLSHAQVVAPVLERLVRFDGTAGNTVHNITLRGLTLSYTDWSIPAVGGAWHQAGPELPSALEASGARACAIENCVFSHLGCYAIAFDKGSTENRIFGNEMSDLGGGGVKIGDAACGVHPNRQRMMSRRGAAAPGAAPDRQAARQTGSRWPLDPADYRAQPDYPHSEAETTRNNVVAENRIHDIGSVFSGVVGIWVGQSSGNTIAHNEIFDTYYSGVSCGWTWGFGPTAARDNIIEFNHIHHIGRGLMSDMGGIYTLGVQPGTVLRNNLIHDVHRYDAPGGYGGWGIYLDSTSSQIRVENNVIHHCDDGSIHQNAGQQNTIVNNILALNRAAQLQRSNPAPQLSFTFEHNVIYYEKGDLFRAALGEGQFSFDHNLYYRTGGQNVNFGRSMSGPIPLEQWRQRGQDRHSLVADPRFVDPEHSDFSLRPDSPVKKIGFKPIDLSEVGRTPVQRDRHNQ